MNVIVDPSSGQHKQATRGFMPDSETGAHYLGSRSLRAQFQSRLARCSVFPFRVLLHSPLVAMTAILLIALPACSQPPPSQTDVSVKAVAAQSPHEFRQDQKMCAAQSSCTVSGLGLAIRGRIECLGDSLYRMRVRCGVRRLF